MFSVLILKLKVVIVTASKVTFQIHLKRVKILIDIIKKIFNLVFNYKKQN